MKKLYLTSLICLLAASGAVAAPRFIKAKGTKARKAAIERKAPKASPLFKPLSQADYLYEDGEWVFCGQVAFTYDAAGNTLSETVSEEDGCSRTLYTYDELGRVLTTQVEYSEDGEGWAADSRLAFEWDSRVPDYFTSRMGYSFDGETWVRNYYCQTNDITRDDKGNITSILVSLPLSDTMVPGYRYDWTYDEETGQAVEFHPYSNYGTADEADWQPSESMSYGDIEWAATDGQLVADDIYSLVAGNNRVSAFSVYYQEDEESELELDGHVFVEYSAENAADYTLKETTLDPSEVGASTVRTTTDANGSYTVLTTEFFDWDSGEIGTAPTWQGKEEVVFDDHGNIVLEAIHESGEDDPETLYLAAAVKYDYIYDDNGNIVEYTTSNYDYETEEYTPEMRTVYEEYIDVNAGIEDVTVGNGADVRTVYNLQGIPVIRDASEADINALPAGIYISAGRKFIRK